MDGTQPGRRFGAAFAPGASFGAAFAPPGASFGEVPVAASDSSGRQAVEPFFMFRAEMQLDTLRGIAAPLRHGRAGWVRIRLPPRPLAVQAWRSANQYFQRRYKL